MGNGARQTLPPDMAPARAARLAEIAALTGARWAKSRVDSLHAEGRRATGGWPGTLSEARNYVGADEARVGMSYEELSWMARLVYDSARRDWLARRDSAEE